MLRRVDESLLDKALELLNTEPLYNIRIISLLNAYGTSHNFFNVYINDTTVLAELEGNFFIGYTKNSCLDEVEEFLKYSPQVLSISGEKNTIKKIISSDNIKIYSVMIAKESSFYQNLINFCKPPLKEVYNLLKDNVGDGIELGEYMPWYADMSHRIRHDSAKVYGIKENDRLVSVLLLTALSNDYTLIGGVVSDKNCRNKGYATALLKSVTNEIRSTNKTPVLECKKELESFYKRLEYEKIGEYASIEFNSKM